MLVGSISGSAARARSLASSGSGTPHRAHLRTSAAWPALTEPVLLTPPLGGVADTASSRADPAVDPSVELIRGEPSEPSQARLGDGPSKRIVHAWSKPRRSSKGCNSPRDAFTCRFFEACFEILVRSPPAPCPRVARSRSLQSRMSAVANLDHCSRSSTRFYLQGIGTVVARCVRFASAWLSARKNRFFFSTLLTIFLDAISERVASRARVAVERIR